MIYRTLLVREEICGAQRGPARTARGLYPVYPLPPCFHRFVAEVNCNVRVDGERLPSSGSFETSCAYLFLSIEVRRLNVKAAAADAGAAFCPWALLQVYQVGWGDYARFWKDLSAVLMRVL